MSPPRRRSTRLRTTNGTPFKVNNARLLDLCGATDLRQPTKAILDQLAEENEHDSTPSRNGRNDFDRSPMIPSTPATAGRIQPPRSEMHPSQARSQQSTKKADTGAELGFSDIGTSKPEPLTTPSKITMPTQSEFDFRFARPTESLGPEAKQMMAEIREEAQRIKAELQAKHEEEKAKNGDGTSSILGGRKFAQPKGKASRYSELHMNEFKKMDSIAGHPSAFRAQLGRDRKSTRLNSSHWE